MFVYVRLKPCKIVSGTDAGDSGMNYRRDTKYEEKTSLLNHGFNLFIAFSVIPCAPASLREIHSKNIYFPQRRCDAEKNPSGRE